MRAKNQTKGLIKQIDMIVAIHNTINGLVVAKFSCSIVPYVEMIIIAILNIISVL